ncbi:IS630 family transposase [Spirillospora sp. CA-128828]|uniref:IS630 family transposase n=1 Tax=Spirillospora sp. CA-128828 TaxID=3240033 RepID=UPI003D8A0A98
MAKKGRRSTYEERLAAVRMLEQKVPVDRVAAAVDVDRSTLLTWWKNYRLIGPESLRTKRTRGSDAKLSDAQMRELYALLVGADPRQLNFGFALWTRAMVGELILRRFKIRVSVATAGRVLKRLGMSPQKPLYRAYQQDPERVAQWKTAIYPEIRRRAAQEDAEIFFADEASVRTDFHAGTTWAPVGRTPVVAKTGARTSVMMISAVSPKGKLRFMVHDNGLKSEEFITFCRRLLDDVPGKKVFLIVDGGRIHTSKMTRRFVQRTERLELFFLPPYSPELNPDEWVWKVRHERGEEPMCR